MFGSADGSQHLSKMIGPNTLRERSGINYLKNLVGALTKRGTKLIWAKAQATAREGRARMDTRVVALERARPARGAQRALARTYLFHPFHLIV